MLSDDEVAVSFWMGMTLLLAASAPTTHLAADGVASAPAAAAALAVAVEKETHIAKKIKHRKNTKPVCMQRNRGHQPGLGNPRMDGNTRRGASSPSTPALI